MILQFERTSKWYCADGSEVVVVFTPESAPGDIVLEFDTAVFDEIRKASEPLG
jgi:hypothetical protein